MGLGTAIRSTAVREQYERVLDGIDAIVWEADVDPVRFTYVSPAAERLLGHPVERWAEPGFWASHIHPDDREWVLRYCSQATAAACAHTFEYRMLTAAGAVIWLRDTVTVESEGGRPRRCFGVMVDVTERKHAEASLQRALSLQEATIEAARDGLLVVDRDDRLVGYNGMFARMFGLRSPVRQAERDVGTPTVALEGDWDPARILDKVRTVGVYPEAETADLLETEDGRVFERCSRPQRLGDAVVGRVWTFRDVTAQRKAEQALRRFAADVEDLFQEAPCGYHSLDPAGVVVRINDTALRWLGYPRDEVLGQPFGAMLSPRSREAFEAAFPHLSEWGALPDLELEMVRRDGTVLPVLLNCTAVRDASGGLVMTRSTTTDITALKRVETALRQEEERYRFVSLATSDAIYDRDLRTGRVERNAAFQAAYGPRDTPGDAFGWWESHLHARDRERVVGDLHATFRARRTPWTAEYGLRRCDGTYATVVDQAYILYDAAGEPVRMLGAITDVTERRRAEDALRESEERFRTVARAAPVGIYRVDADGHTLFLNDWVSTIFGMPPEALVDDGWASRLHADDRERVVARWGASLRDGLPFDADYRLIRPDGTVAWVLAKALPLTSAEGERRGFVGTLTDITERKQAEEELALHRAHLEELVAERTRELAVANRELESFSYSVSHDLRAPLRAIDGFSRLLEHDLGERLGPEAVGYIARIRQGTQRMALLIDDLLRLSRVARSQVRREEVDLSEVARSVADELRASGPDRQVQIDIQPGMTVKGDQALLRILVDNLLGNAWKFTSKKPTAHIAFFTEEEDGRTVYRVRDDGVGFDRAFAGRLFQTFNRLHSQEEFEGTGIGLATVRRVVERHGGKAWADGELGKGATVSFTLWEGARTGP